MKLRVAPLLMITSAAFVATAADPPPRSARRLLAPTGFAGWRAWNVTDPVVVRQPGGRGLRMYYSGAATEQVNDSAWDLWATGAAVSRDGKHWTLSGGGYEPVLRGRRWLEGEVVDPAAL